MGNNDKPYMCIIDHIYTVANVEVHTSHTKIELKGIIGKFNSVCLVNLMRQFVLPIAGLMLLIAINIIDRYQQPQRRMNNEMGTKIHLRSTAQ